MTVPALRYNEILIGLIVAFSVFTATYFLSSTVRSLSKIMIALLGFVIGVVSYQIAIGGL